MDERELGDRAHARPWATWALAVIGVAALIRVGVAVAPDWYRIFGPYLLVDLPLVTRAGSALVPFMLAAAILVAAPRWPAGRRSLHAGVLLLVAAGLLDGAQDVILAPGAFWFEPSTGFLDWLPWLSIAGLVATVAATMAIVAGVRSGRHPSAPADGRAWSVPQVAAALIGVAATVTAVLSAFPLRTADTSQGLLVIVYVVLLAARFASQALLAVVALRSAPADGPLPETLIAGGSLVALVGIAVRWIVPYAPFVGPETPAVVFAIPSLVALVGFVVLAAGFLAVPRPPRVDALAAPAA